MKILNTRNQNKPLLALGIFFLILGTAINVLVPLYFPETSPDQTPLLERYYGESIFVFLVFALFVAPVKEEALFRLWTMPTLWNKVVSMITIPFFVYFKTSNLFFAALSFIFLIVVMLFVRKNLLTAIITSAIFAGMHLGNISPSNPIFLIQLFGLSLILSYLGLRYNMLACLLGHMSYNLLAILMIVLSSNQTVEFSEFENTSYTAKLSRVSIFSTQQNPGIVTEEKIFVTGPLTELIPQIFSKFPEIHHVGKPNSFTKHQLSVTSKPDTTISKLQLAKDIIDKFNLKADTIKLQAFCLAINLDKDQSQIEEDFFSMTLYGFINYLRTAKNLPVVMAEDYPNIVLRIENKMLNAKSAAVILQIINNNPMLSISPCPDTYLTQVVFSVKSNRQKSEIRNGHRR